MSALSPQLVRKRQTCEALLRKTEAASLHQQDNSAKLPLYMMKYA
jgi:hypothetical protein